MNTYALIWFMPDGMRERGFPTYESADRWAMDHIHPFDSPTGGSTVPNIDDSLFSDDFINYAGREYVGGLYARRVNRYAVIVKDIMTAPHFTRQPGSTHVLVYAAPHGELLATYWPSEAEAQAELPRLRALGVDHMRVESLAELDELEGLS